MISRRLLVIEGQARSEIGQVYSALQRDADFSCDRVSWDHVDRERLGRTGEELIIAVAAFQSSGVAEVFDWLRRQPIAAPTIAVLPDEVDEWFLNLVSQAADDLLFLPLHEVELRHRVRRVLAEPQQDLEAVRQRLTRELGLTTLVGRDPAFLHAIEHLPRFAATDYSVLITGETGTGKELCARALHSLGHRHAGPFVAVDCGAIPEQLFENELFGHVRGAFTDAHRDHRGLISMAQGGTLFLDEIDALSHGSQAKLLRFLQEHTFRALGSDRFQGADVRIVAATNRDLESCVNAKEFRSDLFFRLNILRIHLPALRDRRSDVEVLAYHILKEHTAAANCVAPRSFSPAALRALSLYDWPGNVRELCNVVQRAIVSCDGDRVLPSHLTFLTGRAAEPAMPNMEFRAARAAALAMFERGYVEALLRKHHGNVTHAAREARQDRRAFGRFVKKYQINRRALLSNPE